MKETRICDSHKELQDLCTPGKRFYNITEEVIFMCIEAEMTKLLNIFLPLITTFSECFDVDIGVFQTLFTL